MITQDLTKATEYPFNRSFDQDLSTEEEEALEEYAAQIISDYGWPDTFASWNHYLRCNCKTPDASINFANLFWWFGGQEHIVPDPYDFLGYLYYLVNLEPEKYDGADILDSIAVTILPKAGYPEEDLVLHADYMPENDPVLIKRVEGYRKKKTDE